MAKKLTPQQAGDMLEMLSPSFDVIEHSSLDGSKWTVVKYLDTDLASIRDDYGKVLKKAREFAKANSSENEHYNIVRYLLVYALEHARTSSYYGETLFEQVATATFGGCLMFVNEKENRKEKKK